MSDRIPDKHRKKPRDTRDSKDKKKKRRRKSCSSSESSVSDEWVEQVKSEQTQVAPRDDWMSMTGMLKTYTKEDVKPKREEKEKNHIDSYNPSTSVRELNPYWKNGGSGLPQTAENFRKSRQFVPPTEDDDDDYYTNKSSFNKSRRFIKRGEDNDGKISSSSKSRGFVKPTDDDDYYGKSSSSKHSTRYDKDRRRKEDCDDDRDRKPHRNEGRSYSSCGNGNWRRGSDIKEQSHVREASPEIKKSPEPQREVKPEKPKSKNEKYLSDEKMNKLAAKIVKAEIMGDNKAVQELKAKLEAAREYRKQNPHAAEEQEDDGVMLMATSSSGSTRPLTKSQAGDARSKGGKRKSNTYDAGQRTKYFGNDDRFNLAEMFQQEKYGNNYDDEAQIARIASKSKNPNDDLEDIFVDEISKNRNEGKDHEKEKQRAINQHVNLEKSLEGCQYCVDSKNMLKHLMVSYGTKVYLALPATKSMVKNQCLITTIQHATCVTALDEDVWEEIMNYRKAVTSFFNSQNMDVIFFETATRLHRFPHLVINCIPMPRDVGDMASIYFKKALLECETEWSMNKKVVDLKGKNIRKGVPKGLPYFWIDFGMEPGFAHVIEDQMLFPKNFAEAVIGGILDLDHYLWKKPQKEYGDLQRKKVLDFIKEWKPFDIATK